LANGTRLARTAAKCSDAASGATRKQAFRRAKRQNDIPTTKQPDRTIKPGTPDGNAAGLLPGKNLRQYEFTNSKGNKVNIREDAPTTYPDGGSQGPHFNSGPAGGKLKGHHYYKK
jgi:HNH/Endo VII superfamily nuclease toxins